MGYRVKVNDKDVDLVEIRDGAAHYASGNERSQISRLGEVSFLALEDGKSLKIFVEEILIEEKIVRLRVNGKKAIVKLSTELDELLKTLGLEAGSGTKVADIKAPMPGLIHSIAVKAGDVVKKGDVVLILEAMKMENVIKSPADGEISKVNVKAGDSVEKGHLLMSFKK